jgi:hypothetical protein
MESGSQPSLKPWLSFRQIHTCHANLRKSQFLRGHLQLRPQSSSVNCASA